MAHVGQYEPADVGGYLDRDGVEGDLYAAVWVRHDLVAGDLGILFSGWAKLQGEHARNPAVAVDRGVVQKELDAALARLVRQNHDRLRPVDGPEADHGVSSTRGQRTPRSLTGAPGCSSR